MSLVAPVEIVRRAWQAAERDGLPALLAFADPSITWILEVGATPVLRGVEQVLEHHDRLRARDADLELRGHRFEDHGNCVVVTGRMRTVSSEGLLDHGVHWQVDVRDGRIAHVEARRTVAAAREACAGGAPAPVAA